MFLNCGDVELQQRDHKYCFSLSIVCFDFVSTSVSYSFLISVVYVNKFSFH